MINMAGLIYLGHNEALNADIYVDDNDRTLSPISRCKCCTRENVLARVKYHTCVECEAHLQNVRQARSRITKHSSDTVLRNQLDRLQVLIDYESRGGEVPKWVQHNYDKLSKQLQESIDKHNKELASRTHDAIDATADLTEAWCAKCGQRILIEEERAHSTTTCLCLRCAERYDKYRKLRNRINALRPWEVAQLRRILAEYKTLALHGYWSPPVIKLCAQLNHTYGEADIAAE